MFCDPFAISLRFAQRFALPALPAALRRWLSSSGGMCFVSHVSFVAAHSAYNTGFLSLPSTSSIFRRMRGPWIAHISSPKPLSVARSKGSAEMVQSAVCHIEASRYRYPQRAAGCIA